MVDAERKVYQDTLLSLGDPSNASYELLSMYDCYLASGNCNLAWLSYLFKFLVPRIWSHWHNYSYIGMSPSCCRSSPTSSSSVFSFCHSDDHLSLTMLHTSIIHPMTLPPNKDANQLSSSQLEPTKLREIEVWVVEMGLESSSCQCCSPKITLSISISSFLSMNRSQSEKFCPS